MATISRADPLPRSVDEPGAAAPPRETSEQLEESVTELARRLLIGTVFHLATLVFVELRMGRADGLPHAATLAIFLGFTAARATGIFLALYRRAPVRWRLRLMAVGAVGANVVWGVRTAAVHVHTGTSEQSIVMLVVMCGLTTGAMTAYAPSLWVQRAAQSAMFVPVLAVGIAGYGPGSLTVLYALFYVYILARGGVAHREYWASVHTNALLRRHAASAQRAAAATDAANQQLRAEIAHSAQIEAELRQAQKLEAIGRLAAGIAHEINTPLQFITDSCRFLGEGVGELTRALDDYRRVVGPELGPEIDQLEKIDADRDVAYLRANLPGAAALALHGLERVGKIVAATKDYAAPRLTDKTLADVNRALESAILLSNNEIRYVADVETELGQLPAILCHTGELNQAILNILINAGHAIGDVVKDTGARGTIRIRSWADPGWVRISISDTGTGIPGEILDKIYEPFFTTKPVGRGTGQGLATVRAAVVNKHGGTIDVASQLGVGTTFTISLPIEA